MMFIVVIILGVGGLPEGSSLSGLILVDEEMMNDTNYSNRVLVSSLMAKARGSTVYARSYNNITIDDISKCGYLLLEPNKYNQQTIYSCFKYFENALQKPIFSLTNLITDDEIRERLAQVNVESSAKLYQISLDCPIGMCIF